MIPDTIPPSTAWTPMFLVLSGGADVKRLQIGALAGTVGSIPVWGLTLYSSIK